MGVETTTAFAKATLFILTSGLLAWRTRSSLRNLRGYGLYRLLAWEAILALFLLNVNFWFAEPWCPRQLCSWALLLISPVMAVAGLLALRTGARRDDGLIAEGIYRYIRHPLYSSLLFLAWGIFLKRVSWIGGLLGMTATLAAYIAARKEEVENIGRFGEAYRRYMEQTKMFIPFLC